MIAGRSFTVTTRMSPWRVELHVVEEAGLVQRADRLLGAVGGQRVAFLDRQVGEHGARRDARQAVDADVGDDERLERERLARRGRRAGSGRRYASSSIPSGISGRRRAAARRRTSWARRSGHARIVSPAGGGSSDARDRGRSRLRDRSGAGCRCRTPGPSGRRAASGRRIGRRSAPAR